jgi:signal transduction histidine kinase
MEEQLRQNERLSALGLLAAEVAHEIRNPLTVMKMLYHSLDLRFPENDPRATDVRILGEKMEGLNRTVEQILDFARSTEPQMKSVNVNGLLDSLDFLIRHKLRNHNVTLTKRLASPLPLVTADATQLEQAFLNLILNAVQAMPNGGSLTIQTECAATSVSITIADTGAGMSAEERVFTSLLKSRKAGGAGLGLAIVRRVVETHRGELRIDSRPGEGTRITVTLPVVFH